MPNDGGDISDIGGEDKSMETGTGEMLSAGLKDIGKEINDFKTEIKKNGCDMFVCFRLSGGVVLPVQRMDHQSNQGRFMSNHTVPLKSFRK